MKPALSFRHPDMPESWHDLPNGELILAEINAMLKPWWSKFFGYYLVAIGDLSRHLDTSLSVIHHKVNISPSNIEHRAALSAPLSSRVQEIRADVDDLPLLKRSVDVCLLSHVLEFSIDPHHVVREANRVLVPNGYVVITGYNPFSLLCVNKWLPYRRAKSPWCERFFSAMRIKDWLHLMGYEIVMEQHAIHSTLEGNIRQGPVASAMKDFAERYLPKLGSIYVIIAKKREFPLTPIKPKWQLRTGFKPSKVAPVSSTQSKNK